MAIFVLSLPDCCVSPLMMTGPYNYWSNVQFTSATERSKCSFVSIRRLLFSEHVSVLQTCCPALWNEADWVKPRFRSINSITAVWPWFKVDWGEGALVWMLCIQGLNWVSFFLFFYYSSCWSFPLSTYGPTQFWPPGCWAAPQVFQLAQLEHLHWGSWHIRCSRCKGHAERFLPSYSGCTNRLSLQRVCIHLCMFIEYAFS